MYLYKSCIYSRILNLYSRVSEPVIFDMAPPTEIKKELAPAPRIFLKMASAPGIFQERLRLGPAPAAVMISSKKRIISKYHINEEVSPSKCLLRILVCSCTRIPYLHILENQRK